MLVILATFVFMVIGTLIVRRRGVRRTTRASRSIDLSNPTIAILYDHPRFDNLRVDRDVTRHRFPTLSFVEQGLTSESCRFSTAPNAADLERQARSLVQEHWSDSVWTTGFIPQTAFERVITELNQLLDVPLSPPVSLLLQSTPLCTDFDSAA